MSTDKTFQLFPRLPPELRQQIWRHALLAPAVWFATFLYNLGHGCRWDPDQRQQFALIPVGPAPPTAAGFACREARREMESLITNPWRFNDRGQLCWIHWETTVIHLGRYDNAIRFYGALHGHEKAWFKHVAFEFPSWCRGGVMLISGRVALGSPNLRTLIVHMRAVDNADTEWEDAQHAQRPSMIDVQF
ncbi:hypothetical protein B0T11DRAFT_77517 [Plectosphaerella cucumerina]|uniref:2EXR domain-containing protein n=1 Tax=Plectosphaerella cucumerina TaxID=40658 RepID=A0A8K0TDY1_9PEZI|nr:hypothetical protein B0T11DRAFT_77517 [Plectosphaerella cucumerina]